MHAACRMAHAAARPVIAARMLSAIWLLPAFRHAGSFSCDLDLTGASALSPPQVFLDVVESVNLLVSSTGQVRLGAGPLPCSRSNCCQLVLLRHTLACYC